MDQSTQKGWAAFIVRTRWLWIVAGLALTVAMGMGLGKLSFNPDARIFFAEENPDRTALDRFESEFAKDDNLILVMNAKEGGLFEPKVLSAIGELTEEAWLLPHVRRVDSLTNFQHTYAIDDEMIVGDLVPEPASVTPEQAAAAQEIALSRPELLHTMIDPTGRYGSMQVMFRLPGKSPETEVPEIVAETQVLAAAFREKNPDIELRLTGSVMMNNQFAVSGQDDGKTLTPLMFGAILLIVFLAFRSVVGVLITTTVIAMSAVIGLGALGWSGTSLNSVTVLAPLIIMTLAVASVVHVLASARQTMVETPDRKEWARVALDEHGGEIAVACITTAIGFLALNFSISPPFRELGNVVAVGVMGALFLTLTFLPALIVIIPMKRREALATTDRIMAPLAEFVIGWRKPLLVGMSLLVIALASGIPRLSLEDDFVRYFDDRYEFRRDTDYFERHLGGLNVLEYALPAGRSDGINDPAFLANVKDFTEWLRAQPEVTNVRSLTDVLQRLNMNMHADDPGMMKLPVDEQAAAQFLFLYELSLGYGMDLTDQINIDRSSMRISVSMAQATTKGMLALDAKAQAWMADNAPSIAVAPTGMSQVFNLIAYRDVRAMLLGTVLALIAISALLLLILRDVKLGLISLVPNLVPAAMAFGLWGYGVGAVTLAIAVVIAMTLGIVVDDTVHFLAKYKEGKRQGMTPEDAVRYTFSKVGMALFVTTFALVVGFAILSTSGFAVNGDMAKLTALTISLALVADFLLLPALLITIDRRETMNAPATVAATLAALIGIGALAAPSPAHAQSAEAKGLAIVQEAERRDLGWGDFTNDGEMILRDAGGNETRRIWRGMNLERDARSGEGDWSVIVFSSPRDISGTATLTQAKIEPSDDDQWLYLPAVKRVKRISSSNRTGKFVGSEFSFEDLGSQEVEDNTYRWLRDEACPGGTGLTCHVIEGVPKNARSGYSKRVTWVDATHFNQHKTDFYNRRGDLEKTLTATGYQQYLGKYWRPARLDMQNVQTGKSTTLLQSKYSFGTGMNESDFNAQRLPRLSR